MRIYDSFLGTHILSIQSRPLYRSWMPQERKVSRDRHTLMNTRDSLYLFLWNIISGVHQTRFWFVGLTKRSICQCGCDGQHTFQVIWDVLAWALQACLLRRYPKRRHDGVPFSKSPYPNDRKRAQKANQKLQFGVGVVQKRGDWQWLASMLNLANWASRKTNFCFRCACDVVGMQSFGLHTEWRHTVLSHTTWLTEYLAARVSGKEMPLLQLPGFLITYVAIDWMHCADLGITQYLIGNVMYLLFLKLGGLVSAPGPTLQKMHTMVWMASKALRLKQPPCETLTMPMIKGSGASPRMKLKAAETRRMLPVVHYMISTYMPPESSKEELVLQCTSLLLNAYQEMDPKSFDADSSPRRLAEYGRRHLLLYGHLSQDALQTRDQYGLYWRIYPKHHLFCHLLDEVFETSSNPLESWNYKDESEIGDAAKLAACLHPRTLSKVLLERYRL